MEAAAETSRVARMMKTQEQRRDDAASEGPQATAEALLRQPELHPCSLLCQQCRRLPKHAPGPCIPKAPNAGQSCHELPWAGRPPAYRGGFFKASCDNYPERPHQTKICSESPKCRESLQALGGKLQDWRPQKATGKFPSGPGADTRGEGL